MIGYLQQRRAQIDNNSLEGASRKVESGKCGSVCKGRDREEDHRVWQQLKLQLHKNAITCTALDMGNVEREVEDGCRETQKEEENINRNNSIWNLDLKMQLKLEVEDEVGAEDEVGVGVGVECLPVA